MYSDDGNSGIVIFTYKIGDILTNKAYVATIESGMITDIICNGIAVESNSANIKKNPYTTSSEEALLKLVAEHKMRQVATASITDENIVSEETNYIYDYNKDTLIYQKCVYTIILSADNVIVDTVTEEILN